MYKDTISAQGYYVRKSMMVNLCNYPLIVNLYKDPMIAIL